MCLKESSHHLVSHLSLAFRLRVEGYAEPHIHSYVRKKLIPKLTQNLWMTVRDGDFKAAVGFETVIDEWTGVFLYRNIFSEETKCSILGHLIHKYGNAIIPSESSKSINRFVVSCCHFVLIGELTTKDLTLSYYLI